MGFRIASENYFSLAMAVFGVCDSKCIAHHGCIARFGPLRAEVSGELSGAICLKTLVLLGSALEFVQKILWHRSCDSLALGFLCGP